MESNSPRIHHVMNTATRVSGYLERTPTQLIELSDYVFNINIITIWHAKLYRKTNPFDDAIHWRDLQK